jgi:hypothetical protein
MWYHQDALSPYAISNLGTVLCMRPKKVYLFCLFVFGTVSWTITGVTILETLSNIRNQGRAEKEFRRIGIALERLRNEDASIEWQLQKEWASSYHFAALFWMSFILSCTGRWS